MATKTYTNFDILFDVVGDGYRARVLASPAGEAETTFRLPFNKSELGKFYRVADKTFRHVRLVKSSFEEEPLNAKQFGSRLFDTVFANDVGSCLMRSLDAVQRDNIGLRIRLRFDREASELAALPWEYLYIAALDRFVVLSTETVIARYFALPQPQPVLTLTPPLTILAVVAMPKDVPALNVEQEWLALQTALTGLIERNRVVLERLNGDSFAALQNRLRQDDIHVLHYIGHGYFDTENAVGGLILADDQGNSQAITAAQLGVLLHDHRSLRLLFLNACHGAQGSSSNLEVGTAQQLVQQGIPALIAMQFAISDQAAIVLARAFYEAIADNYPLDAAIGEARKAVYGVGNDGEWGTPVLFSRSDDNQLLLSAPSAAAVDPLASPKVINTEGGAVVEGGVNAGGDFVGRDRIDQQVNIFVETADEAAVVRAQLQQQRDLKKGSFQRLFFEPQTVLVPGGSFLMGSESEAGNAFYETPQHTVHLAAYRIGKYPVTNGDYLEFVRSVGQTVHNEMGWQLATIGHEPPPGEMDHPVVGITWDEAMAYCAWLSAATKRTYCLPSEAEWEFAARGDDGRRYPWGNQFDEAHCHCAANSRNRPTSVSEYSPQGDSVFGCADMAGNVWEWTNTIWGRDIVTPQFRYPYQADAREQDKPLPGNYREYRICRGGSYGDGAGRITCTARSPVSADSRSSKRGFRLLMRIGAK